MRLFFVIVLISACQSFSAGEHKHQHMKEKDSKPKMGDEDSVMHGWRFERHGAQLPAMRNGDAANGQKLYTAHCQKCHGPNGKGDGAVGNMMDKRPADLSKSSFHHKRHFFYVISEGSVHGMPAWKSVLSAGEIADIIAYIRTLP